MSLMQRSGRDYNDLRGQMNRLFGESGEDARMWAPAVDVSENEDEIVLEAELPGMKKDDIEIQLNGENLVLRGERKLEHAERNEQYHRVERSYGAWQRTFQVEVPIDSSKIAASYDEGILTVRLPKAEETKPRQIEISH